MQKISSQDASSLLKTAGATIRALVEKNAELQRENASFKKEARINSLIKQMDEKGLSTDVPTEEKVAALAKKDLDVVEEAIKMASPQSVGFGRLSEDGEGPGGGSHPFETFIMTGDVE